MRHSTTAAVGTLAALTVMVLLTGCTSAPEAADDVVNSLGAVPIPSTQPAMPAPVTASVGHPQLVVMGAPVRVSLPGDVRALVTAAGPTRDTPTAAAGPDGDMTGVITVTVTSSAGTVHLTASDLACRDQTGSPVALAAVGPAAMPANPGHPATLTVSGTFHDGAAQINWQQDGHVLAIWDFTIESD